MVTDILNKGERIGKHTPLTDSYRPDPDFEFEALKKVSRSFALTIPELPADLGRVVTNAYLICRIIDTIEDDEALTLEAKARFFEEFVQVLNAERPAAVFAADLTARLAAGVPEAERELIENTPTVIGGNLALTPPQRQAIRQCGTIMARGMLEFQRLRKPGGLEDLEALNRYCYFVAGVVGEMLTELFCDHAPAIAARRQELMTRAASFGQGLQMTNIIKDLWEDRLRGTCWLPRSIFAAAGCDLDRLGADGGGEAFARGIAKMIGIARGHLQNALAYTLLIPPEETGIRRFCLWAIGMAVFTLRNINRKRGFRSGSEVKISRRTLRSIIMVSNMTQRSDRLLAGLFAWITHDLPGGQTGWT
ncbi:MAG: phytoene/squalene synthase family protein [Pseudomonadota bacterium]|nr:phytoene/squalene synthase family protein [Pseudomonadota bacterium]